MLYSIDYQELATEMYKRELRAEGKLELAKSSRSHIKNIT